MFHKKSSEQYYPEIIYYASVQNPPNFPYPIKIMALGFFTAGLFAVGQLAIKKNLTEPNLI